MIKKEDMHFLDGIRPRAKHKYIAELTRLIEKEEVTTEEQAMAVANRYMKPGEPSYQSTLAVAPILPRIPKTVVRESKYNHPYFEGETVNTIYIDTFGMMYNKTTGVIKKGIKTKKSSLNGDTQIDALGGSMWESTDGKNFVCEYRTNWDEIYKMGPETFVTKQ